MSVGLRIDGKFTLEVGPRGRPPVNVLTLPVAPGQSVSLLFRTTITQTLSGIWVDRFGLGPQSIVLQGDSAWDSPDGQFNGQHVDGNTAIRHLVMDILEYYANEQLRSPNSQSLTAINGATGETWIVEPVSTPQLTRSPNSPMTIAYTVQFAVLTDLSKGPIAKVADAIQATFSSANSVRHYAQNRISSARTRALSVKQTPYVTRTVQSSDTLYTIAQSYLPIQATVPETEAMVGDIVQLNGIGNENAIFPGMQLQIPQ